MKWLLRILARARWRHRPDDLITATISPGRSTTRRPGESWSEAMDRLIAGHDLGPGESWPDAMNRLTEGEDL